MNINNFVILPGSKTGTSVRLKAKTVRELQLEKVQLEIENEEIEKKLQQLQSNMRREKEERKKSSAYYWKSGQAGPVTIQARVLSQNKENNKKVSSGKVKLQILKEQIQEPVKEPFKHEVANAVAHEKPEVKGTAYGLCEMKSALLDLSSASTCTGLGNLDKGSLRNGTFNEEESARSFQEALLQWRRGSRDHREQLHANEVLSESVGIGEVQTNLTGMKEPVQIEFKDGLSYMEKLLLKKYRRTPVDQISGSCVVDLRPVQTLSVHEAVTGGEGEGDYDVDGLTVEDVKRYWASVFREEVPNTVSESAESSLKIEFLDDSFGKDFEESSDYLVMEAGAVGMNKQGKAELLKEFGRNPVSSKEISQEETVVRSPRRHVVQKESVELKARRRSLSSCKLPEKISDPAELMSKNYSLETQLQKTSKDSQELDSICNSQSLVLPVITEPSLLQDVATRQKSVSAQYWGLEGWFAVGAKPQQVMLEACSSLCADSGPMDNSVMFPGAGKWVTERSLSEYVDDTVVHGVLEGQLRRPSGGLETQSRISPLTVAWRSYPTNDSKRPWSTSALHCKLAGSCSANTQPGPGSSPLSMLGVDTEVSEHNFLGKTDPEEYLWEYIAAQEALLNLEKELPSYTGPEKCYSLTCEDVTSSSRHSEKTCGNAADFHTDLELREHGRADNLRGWDKSQADEEGILEDKQQVLALQ